MTLNLKSLAAAAVLLSGLPFATPSMAGPATDALGQCMTRSATAEDDIVLVRWVFVMIARHPKVADLSSVNKDEEDLIDRQMGAVFERLLARDCAEETRVAMNDEKEGTAMEVAFGKLFEKAFGKVTDEPAVLERAQNFIKYVDMNKVVQAMVARPVKK